MTVIQALGVAAAALVMGLTAGGEAPMQTVSQMAAEARALIRPATVCNAVEELAAKLASWETRRVEGLSDPQRLAARFNATRADARPHSTLNAGAAA